MTKKRKQLGLLILLTSIFASCSSSKNESTNAHKHSFSAKFYQPKSSYTKGDTLKFRLNASQDLDSIFYSFSDGKQMSAVFSPLLSIHTDRLTVGYNAIKLRDGNGAEQKLSFTLLPDARPRTINYSIINTFPHSKTSYTQGLLYNDGILYESTGLRGMSELHKLDIESGISQQMKKMEPQFFGEGLALAGDKLYQLTWQSKTGFVYDRKSFETIQQFTYPTEGWGLCYDGSQLIMSDGSQFLYFIDTASLQMRSQLAVFDHSGAVRHLNELEYVDGYIYANVYMTDRIVKINAETGVVEAELWGTKLLKPENKHSTIDVLNGIAYNDKTGNFYITGKNWPVLFELSLHEETE